VGRDTRSRPHHSVSSSVIFRPAADQDIDAAYGWYERQQVGLGEKFLRSLGATVEFIRTNPELYPIVRGSIRRAVFRGFPYLLFYVVEPERIVVIACLHVSRDPETWPA
jgi:plasmid stabilization system protein ParE